jgi:uncharacterized protein (DUF488 family)
VNPAHGRSERPLVFTVGHSNRPLDAFTDLLASNCVERVIDVRTVPRSRHNPQFNADTLPDSLRAAGIGYTHFAGLGGLRKTHPGSLNTGWRNLSFRGFADYMQTSEFAANIEQLAQLVARERCALMCAEAVPWRCHRSLIGDALLVRGYAVEDILGPGSRRPHSLTPFARVEGESVTYPALDV